MNDLSDNEATLTDLITATGRLLATLDALADEDLRAPSLLPGWTRGHVLAHVARNADAMRNLVTWAQTGVETPAYESRERRDADIERDAHRPLHVQRADVEGTALGLAGALKALPANANDVTVFTTPGREFPARDLGWRRLREVEIHHVDLDAGYSSRQWAPAFVSRALDEIASMFAAGTESPDMALHATDSDRQWRLGRGTDRWPTVSGTERALLVWLIGRDQQGANLTVTPAGPLPSPPVWI